MPTAEELQAKLDRLRARVEAKAVQEQKKISENLRHDLGENTVVKANRLARAYYRFDIVEKRIMEAMISQLNPKLADTQQCDFVELKAVDYAKLYGVAQPKAYQEMAKAVERLMYTVMTISGEKKKEQYTLMAKAEYVEGEGRIVACFNPLLTRYLVGLYKNFTTYRLKQGANFKSSYTWRLFEIMMSWKKSDNPVAGWFTVSVDELKDMLGAPRSYRFKDLRVRAIDKAVEEIHRELNINVWYEPIKRGRKIDMLKFSFMEDEQKKLKF
ncbi:MAG: RepB family plasmid replication initiator protein [Methanobacteriota archaeon]|nr:MAG: RepB family plasmid replication initiator protein [Euryarchaeota archaeon]